MRNPLSDKVVQMKPSGIRKFFDLVQEMPDAISLGVGEPDFDTPWHIREEGIYSLEKGRTFYTSNAGLLELRKAIAHYMYRKYELTYNPAHEIVVTVGGSEGIDLALRAMLNPGDEVILPEPAFVSYLPCVKLADGVPVTIDLKEELFYQLLSEITGVTVQNEGDLFGIISELSSAKKKYDKIAYALEEVNAKGYGIVTPSIDDLVLEEPEMVKQGSRFGVKLKATAPSIHMIKTNVTTEVSPIVGSEKQSEELVNYLLSGFESDPKKIWESNIFGKSLHELVNEGLQTKLSKMPEEAQLKLQETLERIVNEGSGGLICIIL